MPVSTSDEDHGSHLDVLTWILSLVSTRYAKQASDSKLHEWFAVPGRDCDAGQSTS